MVCKMVIFKEDVDQRWLAALACISLTVSCTETVGNYHD